ncbi:MAG: glycerate kinase [Thiogranum sp.]
MKILAAPNAFKGSLSAAQAAEAMRSGVHRVLADADVQMIPVADGGDGLLQTLESPLAAERIEQRVRGPLGDDTRAAFLYSASRRLAIIEMATASGLALLDSQRLDAMHASSEGVGQLISAALDRGAGQIVLGIGGSATTDGATGLATALGMRFLDEYNKPLRGEGASLQRIRRIDRSDLDKRLANVRLEVACDVDNPLLGSHGAARVYAPQKGASRNDIEQLEKGLANLADVIDHQFGMDVREMPGGGAAGGMGAGLRAFFNAELKPGAELVLELLQVEAAIINADLVLTGEGRLDEQTRFGKAPGAVAALAAKHKVPCIAIAGMLDESAYTLTDAGFSAVFSLCPGPVRLTDAVEHAARYLAMTTEQVIRCRQSAWRGDSSGSNDC